MRKGYFAKNFFVLAENSNLLRKILKTYIMKRISLVLITFLFLFSGYAQKPEKDVLIFRKPGFSYYWDVIMKQVKDYYKSQETKQPRVYPAVDMSKYKLPNDPKLYKKVWFNPPISQGNTGTCWSFSTTSFLESDIYRQTGKKVKLSEMYTVYWEYVEKAREFVRTRGKSLFDEGSEANAVTRIMKKYGAVPESAYLGRPEDMPFYDHAPMVKEMKAFLKSVKQNNMWNEEFVLSTIKDILNKYMGQPPQQFVYDGKTYTPKSFLKDYLKINPDDYIDIMSLKQFPYWTKDEYPVPDNWWHSKDYYNVPLDVYMRIINHAIENGYSICIGGDVTEPGFDRETQCAIVPSFDIPRQFIDEDARQFRFSNHTTTDDHGMHLVGYTDFNGDRWYLIKDSSSGSRNAGEKSDRFGYYFFRWDYMKLKIMDIMIHKDALPKDVRQKLGL